MLTYEIHAPCLCRQRRRCRGGGRGRYSSWCCAARPSPVMRSPMSDLPAPRVRSLSACPASGACWSSALLAGLGMGALGERISARDVAVGVVLSLSLGLGLLFLHFYTAFATQVTALLFGNILGVDAGTTWSLFWLGAFALLALASISRPLLFATLQPELAEAKGVSLSPGIAARSWRSLPSRSPNAPRSWACCWSSPLWSGRPPPRDGSPRDLAPAWRSRPCWPWRQAWLGITLAYYTDWPTSFWITALSGGVYFASLLGRRRSPGRPLPLGFGPVTALR